MQVSVHVFVQVQSRVVVYMRPRSPCICKCLSNLYVCLKPPKKERKTKSLFTTYASSNRRTSAHYWRAMNHVCSCLGALCPPPFPRHRPSYMQHAEICVVQFLEKRDLKSVWSSANSAEKSNFSTSKVANSLSRFFLAIGAPDECALSQRSCGVHILAAGKHQFVPVWTTLT